MDDIKAIRDALAAAQKGGDIALHALYDTCHPERIARLLDALELAQTECKQMRAFLSGVHPDLPGQFDNARLRFAAMAASAPQSPPADRAEP